MNKTEIKICDEKFNQQIKNIFNINPFLNANSKIIYTNQEFIFLPEFLYNKGKHVIFEFYKNIKDFHKINREEHILYERILRNSNIKEYYKISDLVNKGAIIKNIAPLYNQMFLENSLLPIQVVVPIAYSYFLKENGDKSQSTYLQYNCINEMFKQSLIPNTNNIKPTRNYIDKMNKINTSLIEDNFINIENKSTTKQGLSVTNGILMGGIAEIEKQVGDEIVNIQIPIVFDIEELFMHITNNLDNAISLLKIYQYSLVSYGIINDLDYANDLLDMNKNPFLKNIFYNIVGKSQKMIKENIMPFVFYDNKNNKILSNNRTLIKNYADKNPFLNHIKEFMKIAVKENEIMNGYTLLPTENTRLFIEYGLKYKTLFNYLNENELNNIQAKNNIPQWGANEKMNKIGIDIYNSLKEI